MYALAKHSPLFLRRIFIRPGKTSCSNARAGFLPLVHTYCRVGFGVLSVKPDCHSSGSIRNLLVYLPPAHRVKKTRYSRWPDLLTNQQIHRTALLAELGGGVICGKILRLADRKENCEISWPQG
jgi:hypothetical protein